MAILPDYTSGLISLANGSVTVTGTGTMFEVAAFKAGDTLLIQNLISVIASVDSNTQLTLAEPWTGLDLVDAPYRLRRTPDGATVSGRTTNLIEMLGNGVLSSIAELPVRAGFLLIGNDAGGYSLVDHNEFGIKDPHSNLAQLAALAKAANHFVIMGADGSITLKPISELTDVIENNRLAIANLKSGTEQQYVRGNGTHANMNKAAVGLGNVENIAPSGMWTAMGGVDNAAYKKLPGGLIFQTGSVNQSGTDYRINFPTAFPTACMWVKARSTYPIEGIQYLGVATTGKTASGVDIRVRNMVAGGTVQPQGSVPVEWFAMGY